MYECKNHIQYKTILNYLIDEVKVDATVVDNNGKAPSDYLSNGQHTTRIKVEGELLTTPQVDTAADASWSRSLLLSVADSGSTSESKEKLEYMQEMILPYLEPAIVALLKQWEQRKQRASDAKDEAGYSQRQMNPNHFLASYMLRHKNT